MGSPATLSTEGMLTSSRAMAILLAGGTFGCGTCGAMEEQFFGRVRDFAGETSDLFVVL